MDARAKALNHFTVWLALRNVSFTIKTSSKFIHYFFIVIASEKVSDKCLLVVFMYKCYCSAKHSCLNGHLQDPASWGFYWSNVRQFEPYGLLNEERTHEPTLTWVRALPYSKRQLTNIKGMKEGEKSPLGKHHNTWF